MPEVYYEPSRAQATKATWPMYVSCESGWGITYECHVLTGTARPGQHINSASGTKAGRCVFNEPTCAAR